MFYFKYLRSIHSDQLTYHFKTSLHVHLNLHVQKHLKTEDVFRKCPDETVNTLTANLSKAWPHLTEGAAFGSLSFSTKISLDLGSIQQRDRMNKEIM